MTRPQRATLLRRSLPAAVLAAFALAFATPQAGAQDATGESAVVDPALTTAQEEAVRALVRETIMTNPEILIEALQLYDQRQKEEAEVRARENLVAKRDELVNDPTSPVIGNPAGDVTIVEFFDYRCPYCKKVTDDLRQALVEDGNVRLVMKEFPILGPESILAARAALAAHKQAGYEDFHFKLMEIAGDINEQTVFAVAELQGLDIEKLRSDMNADEVEDTIRRNFSLAESLDIGGTPAFVIGDQIFPGAISIDDMRAAISAARKDAS